MVFHDHLMEVEYGGGIVRYSVVWPCCVVEVSHLPGLT